MAVTQRAGRFENRLGCPATRSAYLRNAQLTGDFTACSARPLPLSS